MATQSPSPASGGSRSRFDAWPSPRALRWGIVAALTAAVIGQILVQVTFAQTNHPVTLAQANLTADVETLRGYYRSMDDDGTLDLFARTETVDYLWAFGLAALLGLVAIRLGRAHPVDSRTRRIAFIAAPLLTLGGLTDVAENTVSLIMLADPWQFPDWLAPLHAGISSVKLALIIPAVSVLVVLGLAAGARSIANRRRSRPGTTPGGGTDAATQQSG